MWNRLINVIESGRYVDITQYTSIINGNVINKHFADSME